MPRRFARTCPLCGRPGLLNLSTHLLQVHLETNKERGLLLKQAKVSSWQPSLPSMSNRMETQEHSRLKKRSLPVEQRGTKDPLKMAKKPKLTQMPMLSTKPYPEFAFRHKFSLLVVGPSQSGKTYFVQQILQNDHILYEEEKQRRVLWCYSQWQDKYDEMKRMLGSEVSFVRGIPELSDDLSEIDTTYNNLIILDDLMTEAKESPIVARLFTQGRHRNASIILLLQNMFPKGKYNTDISRNAQYIALFRSPSDRKQIGIVGERIFDKNRDRFMTAYSEVTRETYACILVDNKPDTPADKQVICDIFGSCRAYANINSTRASNENNLTLDQVDGIITQTTANHNVRVKPQPKKTNTVKVPTITWSDASISTWQDHLQGAKEMKTIPENYAIVEMYTTSRNLFLPGKSCCASNSRHYWPVKLKNLKNGGFKWIYLDEEEATVKEFVTESLGL